MKKAMLTLVLVFTGAAIYLAGVHIKGLEQKRDEFNQAAGHLRETLVLQNQAFQSSSPDFGTAAGLYASSMLIYTQEKKNGGTPPTANPQTRGILQDVAAKMVEDAFRRQQAIVALCLKEVSPQPDWPEFSFPEEEIHQFFAIDIAEMNGLRLTMDQYVRDIRMAEKSNRELWSRISQAMLEEIGDEEEAQSELDGTISRMTLLALCFQMLAVVAAFLKDYHAP